MTRVHPNVLPPGPKSRPALLRTHAQAFERGLRANLYTEEALNEVFVKDGRKLRRGAEEMCGTLGRNSPFGFRVNALLSFLLGFLGISVL